MRHWFEQLPAVAPPVQAPLATASEQARPDVRQARHIWITRRQPFMRNLLPRLGFIDGEACARHWFEGHAERAQDQHDQDHRLVAEGGAADRPRPVRPLEHCRGSARSALKSVHRTDFRARLTLHSRPAPRPAGRPLGDRRRHEPHSPLGSDQWRRNGSLFDLYVETQLVPTLQPGDVFGPLTRTGGVRGLTPRQPRRPPQPHRRSSHEEGRRVVRFRGKPSTGRLSDPSNSCPPTAPT